MESPGRTGNDRGEVIMGCVVQMPIQAGWLGRSQQKGRREAALVVAGWDRCATGCRMRNSRYSTVGAARI